MKNISPLKCVVFFLVIIFSIQNSFSQALKASSRSYSVFNRTIPEEGILEDGKYTYDYKNKTVSVEIKGDYYFEYFPNKEYIKAKIYWFTKYQYSLTIVDLQKKNFPLKIGDKLNARISKIEEDKYYYESTLNNKKMRGSFRKIR